MNTPNKKGYFNLGLLFLIAGIGMLIAEYSGGSSLDVPDIYAASALSNSFSISTTCGNVGNTLSLPQSLAITTNFASAGNGAGGNLYVAVAPVATITGGVAANGVAAESTLVVNSNAVANSVDESTGANIAVLMNGPRLNRNVQCLGMSLPYAQTIASINAATTGVNSVSVASGANQTTIATLLTTTASYIHGGTGTADALGVDTDLAELLIGGAANMSTGFGWSLKIINDISIGKNTSSNSFAPSLTMQSDLSGANF